MPDAARALLVLLALAVTLSLLPGAALGEPGPRDDPGLAGPTQTGRAPAAAWAGRTDGIVFRPRPGQPAERARARVEELTGHAATLTGGLGDGRRAVELDGDVEVAEAEEVAGRLVREGRVAEAAADRRVTVAAAPNDRHYLLQWPLHDEFGGSNAYGSGVEAAWETTEGSEDVVVAVLDTGVLDHPDIADRLVDGYDFVDDDADASDPGDACETETGTTRSTWHGTHVAGTIGASTDNDEGVAGVDRAARIQPVRVLGECGGDLRDVVPAIRWAAGLSVGSGVPDNPTPADVINLSFASDPEGTDGCPAGLQDAIDDAVAAGALVLAAAGNFGGDPATADAADYVPGNCEQVFTVAATSRVGDRAYYSNHGEVVDLAAAGGDVRYGSPEAAVLSLSNEGEDEPDPDGMTYAYEQGTSMGVAHVSGVAALLLGERPDAEPQQLTAWLTESARAFPTASPYGDEYVCSDDPAATAAYCGAGILDAPAALALALGQPADDAPVWPPTPWLAATAWDEEVALDWSEVQHEGGIEAYELHRSETSTCSRASEQVHRGPGTAHTDTGLEAGTTYRYCLVAVGNDGEASPLSNLVAVTPTEPPDPPAWGPDAELRFDLTAGDDIRLTWPAATGTVEAYEVLLDGIVWTTTSRRSATVGSLAVGRRYRLDVRAVNRSGASSTITRHVTPSDGFDDVAEGSAFATDIRWLATAEITRGCASDLFCPTEGVTRQQMAAFLVRALGLTETSSLSFVDVAADSEFADEINKLATAGITRGCDQDRFCPTDPVTRQQMAGFLVRALELTEADGIRFVDVAAGSEFEEEIDRLATAGITRGCDQDRFCPTDPVTRQQMAAFLRRALAG